PKRWCSTLSSESLPSGTSASGMLGSCASAASSVPDAALASRSSSGIDVLSSPTSASRLWARASSFVFLASPISLEAALRRACAVSRRWIAARRASSSARSSRAVGGSPRRLSARSNSSGCSRMNLMSCIAESAPKICGATWRLFGGFRPRRRRRRLRGRLAFHDAHRPDGALVESHEGKRKEEDAEEVRRGEDAGNDEGDHDEVAPLFAQLLGSQHADAPEQGE